jgi:hypothetical protein
MRQTTTILLWILAIAWLALHMAMAAAHDRNRPELDNWFMSLQSGKGPCCDGSDAQHLSDVEWQSHDGHYRVKIEDQWIDVPDDAVIKQPNLNGRTMVWPYRRNYMDGHDEIIIRCFMPGPMT